MARQLPNQQTKFLSRLDRLEAHLVKDNDFDNKLKAELYEKQGRHDEAKLLSIEIRGCVLGEGHRAETALIINLIELYEKQGRYDEAKLLHVKELETKRRVLGEGHPSTLASMNNFAWLQATSPKAGLRDGAKAIEYATKVCELTEWKRAMYVDTLAAAYAEAGDFDSAIKWQKEAIDLLTEEQPSGWQAEFQARLKLYQTGQPYHRQSLFANQMIALWRLDQAKGNQVLDSSGNGLHGKLVGDANIISDLQKGNVLSLDGDGDWVDCGNDTRFNITGEITLSTWIKVNVFDKDWQAIVTKGDTAWRLHRNRDTNTIKFNITGGPSPSVVGSVNVNDGKWHHVTGVYDGTKLYLYVDGELDSSEYASGSIATNNYNVWIGAWIDPKGQIVGREWNGLIDDVRIYSYALSEAEIKALYAGHGPGPTED